MKQYEISLLQARRKHYGYWQKTWIRSHDSLVPQILTLLRQVFVTFQYDI